MCIRDRPVRGVVEADVFEGRIKRRMSAVIGPVCIDDFQFCQGRVAVLRISIILLNKFNIFRTHGKSHFPAIAFQLLDVYKRQAFMKRSCRAISVLQIFLEWNSFLDSMTREQTPLHSVSA